MKPMIPKRTRRLRARAATMNSREEELEDYGPEPNMKLSHAFMVVLLLHVVAVCGLYAFNSMKHGKAIVSKSERSTEPSAPQRHSSNDQEPGKAGGPGEEPPAPNKAPIVTKVSEASKTTKVATESPAKQQTPAKIGFLVNARNIISKTVSAAGIASVPKAVAQQTPSQSLPAGGNAASLQATPASANPTTYMVKAGDTLTRIAGSLGVSIPDLEKVNGMTEKSVIQVGQSLKVPVKAVALTASEISAQAGKVAGSVQQAPAALAGAVSNAATALTGGSPPAEGTVASADQGTVTEYTIIKGDSPYKIAKKFKVTPDQLMKANGITDPKKIQIGQKLKIPAPTTSKKAAL